MFPLGNGDILGLAIDCRLLQVYFFISDKLPLSFSAAHFILDRLPSCSVILFFEPSTGKNIPFAFIIIQSASNVNADQDEGAVPWVPLLKNAVPHGTALLVYSD